MERTSAERRNLFTKTGGLLAGIAAALLMASLFAFMPGTGEAATWTVTNGGDGGTGALRSVIESAAAGDSVVFDSSVSIVNLNTYLFVNKALTITGPVTIKQNGAGQRVLYVTGDCTFNNLTITGGNLGDPNSNGGAGIYNYSTLTMNNCTVTGNTGGGGILNKQNLTMNSCTISGNAASGHLKAGGIASTATGSWEVSLTMTDCIVENNIGSDRANSGGIYNGVDGTLVMTRSTVRNNECSSLGGGMYISAYSSTTLKNRSVVTGNRPDQICCGYGASYTTDGTCTIGGASGTSATALSGFAEGASPSPRKTTGEPDVAAVERDLRSPSSELFGAVMNLLESDLGGLPGDVSAGLSSIDATLYNAFAYEDVPLADASGDGELVIEFTASWPQNVRYYAALAEWEDAAAGALAVKGYVIPERGVQFEIKPGQPLPDGVTPPDFYEEGEGLMTWRNVIADNGPYDHNSAEGLVSFRAASIRAEAQTASSGGSGCSAVGAPPFALLLGAPLLLLRKKHP